ncbi:MAG: GNAT family N-acetyltransferase [Thermoplasmata archaeon]|nr:GNAT family N-acetyltransferase [Thermoplasmata archaeon]
MAHAALASCADVGGGTASPAFTSVDPAPRPALIEPLLRAILDHAPPSLREWQAGIVRELRTDLDAVPARGRIVLAPDGGPCGVVTWTALKDPNLGWSAYVSVLDTAFDGEGLGGLLQSLPPVGPALETILRFTVWPPLAPSPRSLAPTLRAFGFHPRTRVDCRFELARAGELPSVPGVPTPRPLTAADVDRIARLMAAAYADSPAEWALFAQMREPSSEAQLGTNDLVGGHVGLWRPDASFGIDDGGELAAATMVQELNGFLISEVMVAPARRRRGLATAVIRASVRALAREAPGESVRLVVTRENESAFRLYAKLGFEPDPTTEGVVWVRIDARRSTPG